MTSCSSAVTLDDLEPRSTQTTTLDDHLYFPVIADLSDSHTTNTDNQPRQILRDRLYVGSLHPSVDESVPSCHMNLQAKLKTVNQIHSFASVFQVRESDKARFFVS